MKSILTETNSPKLTSILKSVSFWFLFVFFLFLMGSFLSQMFPAKWERFVYGIAGTIAAYFVTWLFLRNEKKSFADYGLVWTSGTLWRFLKGVVIGTGIFLVIILALLLFSEMQIQRNVTAWDPRSSFWYLSIMPLALMEEIAFRSYPFLKLNKVFGLRTTQIIVAVAFALYHVIQGWSLPISFLGPGIWAFVFGLAAVWSRGIALPTGIHVALNLIQQLLGMKGGDTESIWILSHKEGASAEVIAHADFIGLVTQVLVLVAALCLMEFYVRRKRH